MFRVNLILWGFRGKLMPPIRKSGITLPIIYGGLACSRDESATYQATYTNVVGRDCQECIRQSGGCKNCLEIGSRIVRPAAVINDHDQVPDHFSRSRKCSIMRRYRLTCNEILLFRYSENPPNEAALQEEKANNKRKQSRLASQKLIHS